MGEKKARRVASRPWRAADTDPLEKECGIAENELLAPVLLELMSQRCMSAWVARTDLDDLVGCLKPRGGLSRDRKRWLLHSFTEVRAYPPYSATVLSSVSAPQLGDRAFPSSGTRRAGAQLLSEELMTRGAPL